MEDSVRKSGQLFFRRLPARERTRAHEHRRGRRAVFDFPDDCDGRQDLANRNGMQPDRAGNCLLRYMVNAAAALAKRRKVSPVAQAAKQQVD